MKRACSGYRNQSNLTFRDETTRTREKFQQWQSRSHGSCPRSASNTAFPAIHIHAARVPVWMHGDCMTWTHPLSPAADDLVVCHFYHTTMENLSHQDPAHRLHTELPSLYTKSDPGSALRLATEAISYAASPKLVQEATQLSRKRYIQATRAVRNALQDLPEAGDDQTLYAILLLCGYEVGSLLFTRSSYICMMMPQLTTIRDYYVGLTGTTSMGIPR